MGNTDSLPVISQVKSAVQAISGDTEGAEQTQLNFLKGCPVVSQGTALVHSIRGDQEAARESQMYFLHGVSTFVDAVPVVGHIKGGIHYACGDNEGGESALKSSSRTIGVIGGGIAGGIVLGPAGAIAGGISGGALADGIITGADSLVHQEYKPYGHWQNLDRAIKGEMDAGSWFDWGISPVFDGLGGLAYSRLYNSIRARISTNQSYRSAIKQAIADGEITLKEGETVTSIADQLKTAAKELKVAVDKSNLPAGSKVVGSVVIDIEGNQHVGYSYRLRQAFQVDAFEGSVPSAQQILENRLPGRAPALRGAQAGQAQCAEVHALHRHHRLNGLEGPNATPVKTISIQYDGQGYRVISRCDNCMKVGRYVNMGEVPTDALNGTNIPLDNAAIKVSLGLMAPCECENEVHEHKD